MMLLDRIDWSMFSNNARYWAEGLGLSLALCVLSAVLGGFILGTILAMLRLSRYAIWRTIIVAYVNLMRSTPFLMVLFWFYFLIPLLVKMVSGSSGGINAFYSVLIAFSLFEGAYFSEIIRSGIQAVSEGQIQAAQALGLTVWQRYRWVVLPQAFSKMLPILLTQCIILFQDTSVVYVVGLADFMTTTKRIVERDGRIVEGYLFAATVYFLISFLASKAVDTLKKRHSR
jgi:glutamate/aspartate transport system permease protein